MIKNVWSNPENNQIMLQARTEFNSKEHLSNFQGIQICYQIIEIVLMIDEKIISCV